MDILQRFVNVDGTGKKAKLIFPRYHQWDVVTKIISDVKKTGGGKNYLVDIVPGPGKVIPSRGLRTAYPVCTMP